MSDDGSRDPELDDLLASFDDPRYTSDGAPVPDMDLDDLLTMFDDPTGRTPRPGVAGEAPAAPADGHSRGGVGHRPAPPPLPVADVPVADVPVETGIDWLGAPVFADEPAVTAVDETVPLDVSGGAGPASSGAAGPRHPNGDETAPVAGPARADAVVPGGARPAAGAPGDPSVAEPGAPEPDATVPDGLADGLGGAPADERRPRVREVAIPVERVGVVAVDQETGEYLRRDSDEQLPTGKAFFGRTTIVITDDEVPDIAYLDDELSAPEPADVAEPDVPELDPNTIYIGDADEGLGLDRSPRNTARSGSIDPRIRARRTSVRREADRRRVFVVAVGVGLLLMALIAVGVVASPMFGATDIRIEGAVYTDRDVLDAVTADLEGDPVLLIDTHGIEARLEEVPWVERVRVDARFPHTVVIDIRERRPLACFRGGDTKWRVIDVQGRVLDVLDGQPVAYMPVTGNHPDTARGQFAGTPYASVASLVQVLPAEVRAMTASVGLDAVTGTLTMELIGGIAVRLGSADDLDDKLARLLSQVRRGGLDGVVALDVSTAQIGVVRG